MSVYDEISSFAQDKAAVFLGADSLSTLTLDSFQTTLSSMVGRVMNLAIKPFAVRFDAVLVGGVPSALAKVPDTKFDSTDLGVRLNVSSPVSLRFSLGVLANGAIAAVPTTLELVIEELTFLIDVGGETLTCAAGDANLIPKFERARDFDAILNAHNIDKDIVTRVEGMLLYSGLAAAVSKTVSTPKAIDLRRLFPGVTFSGKAETQLSIDNKRLFITCTEARPGKLGAPCSCLSPIQDGTGPRTSSTLTKGKVTDQTPEPIGAVGAITLGAPTPVDPRTVVGPIRRGTGDSGLYLPNAMAREMVTSYRPAIRIDLSDNGFIGWSAAAIVDFSDFEFKEDAANGRFYVTIRFRGEVYGRILMDLGKLGKKHIADFSATQGGPGVNFVKVGCYFVLGTSGIFIKPVLEDVHIDGFEVALPRIGTLVGSFWPGWGTVIGYVFDTILNSVVSYQLPAALELEIWRSMAGFMFTLIDANYAAEISRLLEKAAGRVNKLTSLVDGGPRGFVVSVGVSD